MNFIRFLPVSLSINMDQYYHKLGLTPGASKQEIKKVYRKLVKKYHPDVNKSLEASGRFIEIHEAYHALTGKQVSAPIHNDNSSWHDYDEEYEMRRKVWEYVKQQKQEREQNTQDALRKVYKSFNGILIIAAVFNLLLILDYALPYQLVEDKFIKVEWMGVTENMDDMEAFLKADGAITLYTANYNYAINVYPHVKLQIGDDDTEITHTTLFNKVIKATATNYRNEVFSFQPAFSIYHGFIYLIPAFLLAALIYFMLKYENQNKITFMIIISFIVVCQLYIFFSV